MFEVNRSIERVAQMRVTFVSIGLILVGHGVDDTIVTRACPMKI